MCNPLVSVIIPVYEVEDWLDKSVRSVLNQTYQNLEIILVDDGSSDNCPAICDELAKEDSRIKVIHKQNQGPSDARNKGVESANGDLIMFLDSDDWIAHETIEQLLCLLVEYDADIAECSYSYVYTDKEVPLTKCNGKITVATPIQSLSHMLCYRMFLPVPCCKLIKREIMNGVSFPTGKRYEDEFTVYKYHLNAKKLVYIDKALYSYNQTRKDSFMHSEYQLVHLDVCEAFRERMYLFWELELNELEQQMCNSYCWVLFENLFSCWSNKLRGQQLDTTISNALRDYQEMSRHKIILKQRYKKAFKDLSQGIDRFGRSWSKSFELFLPKRVNALISRFIHISRRV